MNVNKKPYADYVSYMLRHYFEYGNNITTHTRPVMITNTFACQRALDGYSTRMINIFRELYCSNKPMHCAVNAIVRKYDMSGCDIWSEIKTLERKVAHERGLI